jgi:hypothetical protein
VAPSRRQERRDRLVLRGLIGVDQIADADMREQVRAELREAS